MDATIAIQTALNSYPQILGEHFTLCQRNAIEAQSNRATRTHNGTEYEGVRDGKPFRILALGHDSLD